MCDRSSTFTLSKSHTHTHDEQAKPSLTRGFFQLTSARMSTENNPQNKGLHPARWPHEWHRDRSQRMHCTAPSQQSCCRSATWRRSTHTQIPQNSDTVSSPRPTNWRTGNLVARGVKHSGSSSHKVHCSPRVDTVETRFKRSNLWKRHALQALYVTFDRPISHTWAAPVDFAVLRQFVLSEARAIETSPTQPQHPRFLAVFAAQRPAATPYDKMITTRRMPAGSGSPPHPPTPWPTTVSDLPGKILRCKRNLKSTI